MKARKVLLGAMAAGWLLAGLPAALRTPTARAEGEGGNARPNRPPRREGEGGRGRRGDDRDSTVVRYLGIKGGTSSGHPTLFVLVSPMGKRGTVALTVPNRGERGSAKPDPKIVNALRSLKKGDLVRVSTQVQRGRAFLRSVHAYEPQEGEDDPIGYVFLQSDNVRVGRQIYLVVALEKLGRKTEAFVPNRRSGSGKMEPDLELTMKVAGCKKGAVVDAEFSGSGRRRYLRYIGPYEPPVQGEFGKLVEEQAGDGKTARLEIKVDGKTRSFQVASRGKGKSAAPDPRVLAAARRFKEGDRVEVKPRKAADGTFVVRLRKPPAKKTVRKAGK
jgi:hypothetical protein